MVWVGFSGLVRVWFRFWLWCGVNFYWVVGICVGLVLDRCHGTVGLCGYGGGFGLDGFWVWDGFGFNLWPQVQSSSPDRVLLREHVMD